MSTDAMTESTGAVRRREKTSSVASIAEAMQRVVRAHAALRARLADGSDGDLAAMIVLVKLVQDGPRRAGELAEMMCADPSTVSRQVAALVRFGLIERQADPADGRASILVPNGAGHARAERFLAERARSMQIVTAEWPAADREQFRRLLDNYAAGLDQHRDVIASGLHLDLIEHGTTHSPERPEF